MKAVFLCVEFIRFQTVFRSEFRLWLNQSENAIQLIVGLGNPGAQYDDTRHNAGFWFVEELARAYGAVLQPEKKFFGHAARISINGQDVRLLNPTTFMNRSGQAVGALATFYKIPPQSILVAHDELDLPPGVGRLKQGEAMVAITGCAILLLPWGIIRTFSACDLELVIRGTVRKW